MSREVLAAARRLAERDTLAGTSLTEFAREAGVTRLTSYRRGETRAASLEALRDGERDVLVPILASPGNARARLEHALEAMCDRTDARAELLSGLDAATLNAVYREEGEEARSKSFGPIVRRLRDGSSTDPSGPCLDEGKTVLYAQIFNTYLHLRREHRWCAERTTRAVIDLAIGGLLP